MSGCRWQEKSFSVAIKENKPLHICKCGAEIFNVKYLYNGEIFCQNCFSKQRALRQSFGLGFYTTKDKQYEFVTDMFDGKPVQITSGRQFKHLLKKYNLADASIKECRDQAEFRGRLNAEDYPRQRKKIAENIFSKNKELLRFRKRG